MSSWHRTFSTTKYRKVSETWNETACLTYIASEKLTVLVNRMRAFFVSFQHIHWILWIWWFIIGFAPTLCCPFSTYFRWWDELRPTCGKDKRAQTAFYVWTKLQQFHIDLGKVRKTTTTTKKVIYIPFLHLEFVSPFAGVQLVQFSFHCDGAWRCRELVARFLLFARPLCRDQFFLRPKWINRCTK